MNALKKNSLSIYSIFLFILILSLTACYEYPEISDFQYEDYRRVIGPDGGTINFYQNYENDSIKDILVKMVFPPNALDSFIVFNMYEFESDAVYVDLFYIGMKQNSKFLYFVPVYESDGYNEQTADSIDFHLSIDFYSAVSITYNLGQYNVDENAKLYRIKIPKLNEWSDNNVWVNWNRQGYPEGYYDLDLTYLINGRWTENYTWGSGPISTYNWEAVTLFTYDSIQNTVSFDIQNTDYIYVMGDDGIK